jgi:hypothetical protein
LPSISWRARARDARSPIGGTCLDDPYVSLRSIGERLEGSLAAGAFVRRYRSLDTREFDHDGALHYPRLERPRRLPALATKLAHHRSGELDVGRELLGIADRPEGVDSVRLAHPRVPLRFVGHPRDAEAL